MKLTQEQTKTVKCIHDITCDKCNKSCKTKHGFEYSTISGSWGYDSPADMEDWEAHLCYQCTEELKQQIKFEITYRTL